MATTLVFNDQPSIVPLGIRASVVKESHFHSIAKFGFGMSRTRHAFHATNPQFVAQIIANGIARIFATRGTHIDFGSDDSEKIETFLFADFLLFGRGLGTIHFESSG